MKGTLADVQTRGGRDPADVQTVDPRGKRARRPRGRDSKNNFRYLPKFVPPPGLSNRVEASPGKFYLLQEFIRAFLGQAGQKFLWEKPELTFAVLRLVEYLVDFGFYATARDLRGLLEPLFLVLDANASEKQKDGTEKAVQAAKTCILRILSKVWAMMGQCLVQAALTSFMDFRDDQSVVEALGKKNCHLDLALGGDHAASTRNSPRSTRKRVLLRGSVAKVAPDSANSKRTERRAFVAERFLGLLDEDSKIGRARDVAALCGRSDDEFDTALLKLAHGASHDMLREVLAVMHQLRCPTARLLETVSRCVVVDKDDARRIHAALVASEPGLEQLDTIPRLSAMASELQDLAQRSEQWVFRDDAFSAACRRRSAAILGTLEALVDPRQDATVLADHQRILLKCGLAPAILEAAEVDVQPLARPPRRGREEMSRRRRDRASIVVTPGAAFSKLSYGRDVKRRRRAGRPSGRGVARRDESKRGAAATGARRSVDRSICYAPSLVARRGYAAERRGRGDAAAATRIFRGDTSQRQDAAAAT